MISKRGDTIHNCVSSCSSKSLECCLVVGKDGELSTSFKDYDPFLAPFATAVTLYTNGYFYNVIQVPHYTISVIYRIEPYCTSLHTMAYVANWKLANSHSQCKNKRQEPKQQ